MTGVAHLDREAASKVDCQHLGPLLCLDSRGQSVHAALLAPTARVGYEPQAPTPGPGRTPCSVGYATDACRFSDIQVSCTIGVLNWQDLRGVGSVKPPYGSGTAAVARRCLDALGSPVGRPTEGWAPGDLKIGFLVAFSREYNE